MTNVKRYSPEVRERVVRMVFKHTDEQRDDYGVEPICTVLPIAPSTYYEQKARQTDPDRLPPRVRRDAILYEEVQRVWDDNFQVYGAYKVWRQLNREGHPVAQCTIERLMRPMGLQSARRDRGFKVTTVADGTPHRPPDLMDRDFTATQPNQLWVADLTYVASWAGFVYVTFVNNAFSRMIVGWRVSSNSPARPGSGCSGTCPSRLSGERRARTPQRPRRAVRLDLFRKHVVRSSPHLRYSLVRSKQQFKFL